MSAPEVPPADDLTRDWWEATRRSQLTVQECESCAHVQHPPRAVCVRCGSSGLRVRVASGQAEVDAWTTVHRAAGPGFEPPYVVARVRLAEGPVLLTHLIDQPHPRCGDAVQVAWQPLPDGRRLPVFTPTKD